MSKRKPPWNEFPEDLSTWELCVEEYEKMERKAKLWEDLKFILQGGEWRSPLTINQVLTTMDNIEEQLKDKIPSIGVLVGGYAFIVFDMAGNKLLETQP